MLNPTANPVNMLFVKVGLRTCPGGMTLYHE